jgi:hypothetical protein
MLREFAEPEPSTKPKTDSLSTAAILVIALVGVLVIGYLSKSTLILLGILMFLGARLWFAGQVLKEMSFQHALLVFAIPFMPTLFLIQRYDIAWKPFLLGISGIVVTMIGVSMSG